MQQIVHESEGVTPVDGRIGNPSCGFISPVPQRPADLFVNVQRVPHDERVGR